MDITYIVLIKALIALGIGTLIGLEREHHSGDALVIAGARTYPLVALFGFVLSVMSWYPGTNGVYFPYIVHIGLVIVGVYSITIIFIRYGEGHYGVTSSMALLITYIIGALLGVGDNILNLYTISGVFTGVVATFFLIEKKRIHRIAEKLSSEEIISAAEFILVLLVLLPLALSIRYPVDPYNLIGPGLLFDPAWILTIVIFVSIMSFISFIIIQIHGGKKGLIFTGLFGGFVSSEVATATLASAVKDDESLVNIASVGVYMSIISLLIRNFILCAISAPNINFLAYLSIIFIILIIIIGILIFMEIQHIDMNIRGNPPKIATPFAVRPAFKFAIIFSIVAAIVTLLSKTFGDYGLITVSIGGLISSSAVAASVSRQFFAGMGNMQVVLMVIIISVGFAILNKIFITYSISKSLYNKIKYKIIFLCIAAFTALIIPHLLCS